MKYVDEFRDAASVRRYAGAIARITTRPWTMMEICGGHTHSIVRCGIDQLLPQGVNLLHGPGCPVFVTPAESIDTAIAFASKAGVIFCSFGDMLRLPGHSGKQHPGSLARGRGLRPSMQIFAWQDQARSKPIRAPPSDLHAGGVLPAPRRK